jgi:hypothetical protein
MNQVESQNTVVLSEDQEVKKHQVKEFIKKLEKQEQDPEYQRIMANYRRVQRDYKEFKEMPKEARSEILFRTQCAIISREVMLHPESPYNWMRRDKEEKQAQRQAVIDSVTAL